VVMTSVGSALAQGGALPRRNSARRHSGVCRQKSSPCPQRLDSLVKAIEPGDRSAGWIMSHGHVVLAHGAVPVGNIRAAAPWPVRSIVSRHQTDIRLIERSMEQMGQGAAARMFPTGTAPMPQAPLAM